MKKIEKNKIKSIRKTLSKIPYNPVNDSKGIFFFPISSSSDISNMAPEKADSGMILLEKFSFGSSSLLVPGLIIREEKTIDEKKPGKTVVNFGFASLEYCKEILLRDYLEIFDVKQKDILEILEYQCYLVNSDYLISEYKL